MKQSGSKRPLWQCPKCRHRFVTANVWHSCGRYRLKDHFDGKPEALRETFDQLVAATRTYGALTIYAQKTRIVLQGRVRFASVVVRKNWLDAGLWLRRRVDHPLIVHVESFGNIGCYLHFRLREPQDIDQAMIELLGQAYEVGQQN